MKHIVGLKKNSILIFILMKNMKNKNLRKLPLATLWYLLQTFRNEKLTRIDGKYIINTFRPPFPSVAFDQLMKSTVAVYDGKVIPCSTYVALTNKCGFNCWHCSKADRQGEELRKEVWIQIMKKLQDIGVSIIGFTGGEPLLREDLEDIIKSIDSRSTTILFTSGDGLTSEKAKSLKDAGLFYVAISLDHYDKVKHNKLRGSDRAFDVAVQAIENSLKNGFYTAVQLTVRKDFLNRKSMDKYIEFVKYLGAQEIRIAEPMPTGRLMNEKADIFLDESERELLKNYHIEANRNGNLPKIEAIPYLESEELYGCVAGTQHLYIDAFGNLCPCDFTPLSFGNVHEEGFDVVYQRLREQFDRPRDKCFLLDNIDKIRSCFEGDLPLGYEESVEVCKVCSKGNLPRFYKKLGWR